MSDEGSFIAYVQKDKEVRVIGSYTTKHDACIQAMKAEIMLNAKDMGFKGLSASKYVQLYYTVDTLTREEFLGLQGQIFQWRQSYRCPYPLYSPPTVWCGAVSIRPERSSTMKELKDQFEKQFAKQESKHIS